MARVWLLRLSEVSDVAREGFRLAGAESDELRVGMTGWPNERPLESLSRELADIESDMVRRFCRGSSENLFDETGG